MRIYDCVLCGKLPELVRTAEAHLAALGRESDRGKASGTSVPKNVSDSPLALALRDAFVDEPREHVRSGSGSSSKA